MSIWQMLARPFLHFFFFCVYVNRACRIIIFRMLGMSIQVLLPFLFLWHFLHFPGFSHSTWLCSNLIDNKITRELIESSISYFMSLSGFSSCYRLIDSIGPTLIVCVGFTPFLIKINSSCVHMTLKQRLFI